MAKDNSSRIRHMLDAGQAISNFIQKRQREDLENDPMLFSALIRQLEVFGEAASGISQNFRESHTHIPWPKIIGMRNRLIHAYFDIDPDIVWHAVTVDIPQVLFALEKIV